MSSSLSPCTPALARQAAHFSWPVVPYRDLWSLVLICYFGALLHLVMGHNGNGPGWVRERNTAFVAIVDASLLTVASRLVRLHLLASALC